MTGLRQPFRSAPVRGALSVRAWRLPRADRRRLRAANDNRASRDWYLRQISRRAYPLFLLLVIAGFLVYGLFG